MDRIPAHGGQGLEMTAEMNVIAKARSA